MIDRAAEVAAIMAHPVPRNATPTVSLGTSSLKGVGKPQDCTWYFFYGYFPTKFQYL